MGDLEAQGRLVSPRLVLSVLFVVFVLFVLFVVFVGFVVFVWFVCTFLEKGKDKSIGESMALHSSAAPCYGASAIAGACGAQMLALCLVFLSLGRGKQTKQTNTTNPTNTTNRTKRANTTNKTDRTRRGDTRRP